MEWSKSLNLDINNIGSRAIICSQHFSPHNYVDCFGRGKILKKDAVPFLFNISQISDPRGLNSTCSSISIASTSKEIEPSFDSSCSTTPTTGSDLTSSIKGTYAITGKKKVAGEGYSSTKYIWQPLEASNNAAIKLEENDITLENLAERQQEALYDPLSENGNELGQSTQESLCKAEVLSTDEESPENASRIRLIETFSNTQLNNVFTTSTQHTRLNPEIHSASGSSDIFKEPTQQSLRIRPINLLKNNNLSRKSAQQNKIPSEVHRTINEEPSGKKIRLVETFSGPSRGISRESAQQTLRLVPVESVSLNESILNRTPIQQNPWDPLAFNIIGNRIASIQFLFRKLQEVFGHCQKKGCNPKSVQIISEESDGLNSEILIRCANCAADFEIPLTDPLSLKSCDLNMSILTKEIVSKLGHSGVNAMLENIELPQISSEKYSEVLQSISEREENVVYIKQEVEVKEEPVDY